MAGEKEGEKKSRRTCKDRRRYAYLRGLRSWKASLMATKNSGRAFSIAGEKARHVAHESGGWREAYTLLRVDNGTEFIGFDYDSTISLQIAGTRLYHYLRKDIKEKEPC